MTFRRFFFIFREKSPQILHFSRKMKMQKNGTHSELKKNAKYKTIGALCTFFPVQTLGIDKAEAHFTL